MNASLPNPDDRGSIAWMVRNRVTPNLLMLVLLVGGLFAALNMKQEVFPEFTLDFVTVRVPYPGASPEEVEQGIVLAIEEEVRGIDGIKELTSTAGEGSGSVQAELEAGSDHQKIYQDIQQAVGRITTFPDDAEEPQVTLASRRRDVLEVHLYGGVDPWTMRNVAEQVRDRLLQDPNISLVDLEGAREFEIHIQPSLEVLRRYNLTFDDIANRVARMSVEIPGGGVKTRSGEILVRFNERRDWARQFAEIPIVTTADGAAVRLGDVAVVSEALEDTDVEQTYNGKTDIGLEVFRIGSETPIGVSEAVHAAMVEIEPSLPAGIEYTINSDRSEIYRQRRDLLMKNAGMGLCLVLVLLGLFLELRLAFWVTLGIPVAFFGSFLLLPSLDVTFNMISMFAFIIALGIVVDDAIVVGENVHEYRQRGMAGVAAAIRGAREMSSPVVFSILTNNIAFIPLLFIPGFLGKIWGVIPLVVITVFTISLFEAIYILPAHLAHISDKPDNLLLGAIHHFQQKISRLLNGAIHRFYEPFLDGCIRFRYLAIATSIGLLAVVLAYAMSGRMGMTLMPTVESDQAVVTAVLPYGSPIEKVHTVREHLEKTAREVIEANGGDRLAIGISSWIRNNEVFIRVYLTDPKTRPISTTEVTNLWREKTGTIPDAERLRFQSDRGGPGGGPALTIELAHANIRVLERAGEQLAAALEEFPNVSDIDDGYTPGKQQLDFELTDEGRALGLTSQMVAAQLRHAFYGSEAIRQQRGRNEIRVRVMLPEEQRSSEYDIEQMMIRTPAGDFVPLRQVARVERGRAYTTINRRDGRRSLTVEGNVEPQEETNLVLATLTETVLPNLMRDHPGLTYSFQGRQSDMREAMASIGYGYLFCVFGIFVLLAIPFHSYIQPLIVMTALPFSVVGAILGHLLMGYSLSMISIMGIIALSGVVINDALILIVFANGQRAAGASAFRAIHQAGVRRFRPILLTTLTTFGGLAPMIFETSRQARFMIPMAISLGYGLLFATMITLILVPSLYMVLEDVKGLKRFFGFVSDAGTDKAFES
jgi:multidrug efflux pump subunit AcrB